MTCQTFLGPMICSIFKYCKYTHAKSLSWLPINLHLIFITDDCRYTTGRECKHGACLNGQCHCNDGYGGKGCNMPDDNECKVNI